VVIFVERGSLRDVHGSFNSTFTVKLILRQVKLSLHWAPQLLEVLVTRTLAKRLKIRRFYFYF